MLTDHISDKKDILRRTKSSVEMLLRKYVDGPERLVADAIVRGPESIRTTALEGGLVNNQLRQLAWPLLLLSEDRVSNKENDATVIRSPKHNLETFKQIHLDVPRSVPKDFIEAFEKFLVDFFNEHTDLCFYQGFADVAWAVYRISTDRNNIEEGTSLAKLVLGRLSRNTLLRDAHRETFDAIYSYLPCISAAILYSDRELAKIWDNKDVALNHWAMAPLVSLFTHGGMSESAVDQILDAIIAQECQVEFPLYLVSSLALLPSVRERLLKDAQGVDSVHEIMNSAIANISDAEELVMIATRLEKRLPYELVLKTAMAAGAPPDALLIVKDRDINPQKKPRVASYGNIFRRGIEEIMHFPRQYIE